MSLTRVDIFIAGGGLAGLAAAAAFGRTGFSVLLADPTAPPPPGAAAEDRRSTAFLRPARQLLEAAGMWDALEPHAVPLRALRIVDTAGWPPEPRETRLFEPRDLGTESFGWNLPNALTRRELQNAISAMPGVELVWNAGLRSLLTRTTEVRVTLTNGQRIACRLAIGADGRDSALRDAAGIGTRTLRYGQRALAFTATHDVPHDHVSTEVYNQGGAFTSVPLPDHNGRPASAIVWMNDGRRTEDLADLSEYDFDAEMTTRACGLLGNMTRATPLATWPIITRTAERLTAERVALVAEAAHVLPPIGAQGLNTSLNDISALHALARADPQKLGSAEQLTRYEESRARDIAIRSRVIDLYNRICRSGEAPIQALRRAGLRLVHDTPLRKTVMQAGLGPP